MLLFGYDLRVPSHHVLKFSLLVRKLKPAGVFRVGPLGGIRVRWGHQDGAPGLNPGGFIRRVRDQTHMHKLLVACTVPPCWQNQPPPGTSYSPRTGNQNKSLFFLMYSVSSIVWLPAEKRTTIINIFFLMDIWIVSSKSYRYQNNFKLIMVAYLCLWHPQSIPLGNIFYLNYNSPASNLFWMKITWNSTWFF